MEAWRIATLAIVFACMYVLALIERELEKKWKKQCRPSSK